MEVVAGLALIVGIVAVAARFLPRAAPGEPGVAAGRRSRLPRIVDESIGMYVLRRLLHGPEGVGPDDRSPAAAPRRDPRPFDAAMAARLGIRRPADVSPPRRPSVAAGRRTRWVRTTVLVVAAVAVGLALGTGIALVDRGSVTLGTAGPHASGSGPQASPSPSS
jgi:hypothetical protein